MPFSKFLPLNFIHNQLKIPCDMEGAQSWLWWLLGLSIDRFERSNSCILGQRPCVVPHPQLTFDDHVLKTTSSRVSSFAQISRVKHVLDRNQLVTVINALVFNNEMTVLFYSVVKHIEQKYLSTRLQSVQNCAARIISETWNGYIIPV